MTIHVFHVPCVAASRRSQVWLWLIEFSSVALDCLTLSRVTVFFPDGSHIKPEDSFNPLFKAILQSMPWDVGHKTCEFFKVKVVHSRRKNIV